MLTVREDLPVDILTRSASELAGVLPGPTLVHLPGRRPQPLFVSVLLHGNEDVGWEAVRQVLHSHARHGLPRALSLFVGNVAAAQRGERFLPGQADYNRIWMRHQTSSREGAMAAAVVEEMTARRPFACVDFHNNTGLNPHYSCVRRLNAPTLHLATLFQRTVVYFRRPEGVLIEPFADVCPAVTVECGQPGEARGIEHARDYLQACLHLSALPEHPVAPHDVDLFHTVAIVKIPSELSFSFDGADADLRLAADLDHMNFRELPVGTPFAWTRLPEGIPFDVRDESGDDARDRFFMREHHEVRTRLPVMPSMLTVDAAAIRQDCLCYLMERHSGFYGRRG